MPAPATLATLTAQPNNPSRKGQRASAIVDFGMGDRYSVAAMHTRFDAVEWFVWDFWQQDPQTGRHPIIRQEPTLEAAIAGLEG